MAMRSADASFDTRIFLQSTSFSAIYDPGVFKITPAETSKIGPLLIVASALVLVWRESQQV